MKTKFFTLLFAIVASTSTLFSQSSGTCGENLTWVLSQNTLTISGTGDMDDYCSMASYSSCYAPWRSSRSKIKNVIIENGVTSIGSAAFQDCSVLESVEISNNVINIGASAFNGCSSLTYLTIPNSVINIRGAAFKNCTSLLSVTIGNSVTNIEYAAFSGCTHLTSVHIFDVSAWCGILFEAYEETNPLVYAHNLYLNGNLVENLNISSNITSIESYTFSGCTCMTSISISNSVTSIGESAFSDCSALTSIYCESAAPASISDNTFKNVSPSVYVPQCAYTTYHNAPIWKDMTIVPVQINMQVANNVGGVVVETCGSMEIEAIPFDGYHFKKWLDGNTDNPRTYSLTDKNLNFIAQFEINKYTITLNCDENQGSIIGDKGKYNYETDHTIEAVPNYGYHFTQWSDGETENPREFTLVQDTTFTALFAPNKYTLTIQYDNTYGSVEGDQGSFDYLSEHEIQVNAKYGYHFTEWSDGVTDNPRTLILTKDTTITASFAPNKYQLELIADANMGAIEGEQGSFDYLSEHEITAVPNTGYLFNGWSDGATENPRTITLTRDTSITALFEHNLHTVTLLCDENQGSVSESGDTHHSGSCTITATPNYGYHFTQWTDGDTNNPRTFIVTQDTTFTAEFGIDKNGTCGDELVLAWSYDEEAKELTISGAGSLNSNYTFGVVAPTSAEKVIFDEGVTSVGNSAFANYTTLEEIHLASTIKRIYEQAFYNCENLVNIYCNRDVPCVVYNNTFDGIDKFGCTLHVPGASIEMYKAATGWRDFYYVVALPDDPTGIDNTSINQPKVTKVLRDNQILILRGDNTYTLTGQKVK